MHRKSAEDCELTSMNQFSINKKSKKRSKKEKRKMEGTSTTQNIDHH